MGDKMDEKMGMSQGEIELVEVDFARKFQEAVVSSSVISFKNEGLKLKINSASPDQLLVVRSSINSPKEILDVEKYDETFISTSL